MNEWLLIALMALVTYVPRYLPFGLAGRVSVPALLERALNFVPVAVLSAIVAQAAMIRGGEFDLSWNNYHALSAMAAFVAAVLTRHLFATIASGLLCFVILRVIGVG